MRSICNYCRRKKSQHFIYLQSKYYSSTVVFMVYNDQTLISLLTAISKAADRACVVIYSKHNLGRTN